MSNYNYHIDVSNFKLIRIKYVTSEYVNILIDKYL